MTRYVGDSCLPVVLVPQRISTPADSSYRGLARRCRRRMQSEVAASTPKIPEQESGFKLEINPLSVA
jgi:hypothetical protein